MIFFSVGNGTSITWWNNRGPCNAKFRPQPLWHSKQRIWWTGCPKQTTWRSLWDNDQNTDEVLYSVYISKIPRFFEINRKIEKKNHDYFLIFWVGRFFFARIFLWYFFRDNSNLISQKFAEKIRQNYNFNLTKKCQKNPSKLQP